MSCKASLAALRLYGYLCDIVVMMLLSENKYDDDDDNDDDDVEFLAQTRYWPITQSTLASPPRHLHPYWHADHNQEHR